MARTKNNSTTDADLLTSEETAKLLRIKGQTLRKWRQSDIKGPPYIRMPDGKTIRYERSDVLAYLLKGKHFPGGAGE